MQVGYILQKYTWNKYTLEKFLLFGNVWMFGKKFRILLFYFWKNFGFLWKFRIFVKISDFFKSLEFFQSVFFQSVFIPSVLLGSIPFVKLVDNIKFICLADNDRTQTKTQGCWHSLDTKLRSENKLRHSPECASDRDAHRWPEDLCCHHLTMKPWGLLIRVRLPMLTRYPRNITFGQEP